MLSIEPDRIINRRRPIAGGRSILDECPRCSAGTEVDQSTGITVHRHVDVGDLVSRTRTRNSRVKVVEDDLSGWICFYLRSAAFDLKENSRGRDVGVPDLSVSLHPGT